MKLVDACILMGYILFVVSMVSLYHKLYVCQVNGIVNLPHVTEAGNVLIVEFPCDKNVNGKDEKK